MIWGLVALVVSGLALIPVVGVLSLEIGKWALLPYAAIVGGSGVRALRVSLLLDEGGVTINNYLLSQRIPIADPRHIVSAKAPFPNPLQGSLGCAGFVMTGSLKPIAAHATMASGWRFGKPRPRAYRIVRLITGWAESHGIPVDLKAEDLVLGRSL